MAKGSFLNLYTQEFNGPFNAINISIFALNLLMSGLLGPLVICVLIATEMHVGHRPKLLDWMNKLKQKKWISCKAGIEENIGILHPFINYYHC
jgi:hypothetical protein